MTISKKHKAAIKSYLRTVAASGITVALAIAGDVRPEYAVLLGAFVAPIIGGQIILSGVEHSKEELQQMDAATLKMYRSLSTPHQGSTVP